ncbi:putative aminotransferase [Gorgonomyces haynaldii]|nr:putative aminotransferase [Gorgonomyces haynaldii]
MEDRTLFPADKPDWISFEFGAPGKDLLPPNLILEAAQQRLSEDDAWMALQYGPMLGDLYFRKALAQFLSKMYQSDCSFEHLCINNGASQSFFNIITLFCNKETVFYVENPTYFLALRVLQDHEIDLNKTVKIPVEEDGLDVDYLEQQLKRQPLLKNGKKFSRLLYLVPTFSNPTGGSLSLEKRRKLVELAEEYDMLVVCDDIYQLLHFPGFAPPPRLVSLDTKGYVISNCSFSKLLAPGVRVGWVEAHPRLIDVFFKSGLMFSSGSPNHIMANVLLKMIENQSLERHVLGLQQTYESRCNALCDALERYLPSGCILKRPKGGFFVWIETQTDTAKLLQWLRDQEQIRVSFTPGNAFSADLSHGKYLRMAFSLYQEPELEKGAERLGKAMKVFKSCLSFYWTASCLARMVTSPSLAFQMSLESI